MYCICALVPTWPHGHLIMSEKGAECLRVTHSLSVAKLMALHQLRICPVGRCQHCSQLCF